MKNKRKLNPHFCTYGYMVLLWLAILALSSCSHNPCVITIGKSVRLGTAEYGEMSYIDGIAIVDVSRENSSWSIEVDDETGIVIDKATNTIRGIKRISRTIGKQVTGYLNDLAETSPEAALEYLK